MTPEESLDFTRSIAFANTMRMVPQVDRSVLRDCVNALSNFTPAKGKMFTFDYQGKSEPSRKTGRAPETPDKFIEESRRVGFLFSYNDSAWLDTEDKLHKIHDPTSGTMKTLIAGKERQADRIIMDLFTAPAREGESGENIVPFPSTNIIGVQDNTYYKGKGDGVAAPSAADRPLTPAKIRHARKRLGQSLIKGQMFIAVSEEDLSNLLTSDELTNADYTKVQALVDGEINTWLGFTFKKLADEFFSLDENGNRIIPTWIKETIEYRETDLITAKVTTRNDRSHTSQAYYEFEAGGGRVYDNGVQILKVKPD